MAYLRHRIRDAEYRQAGERRAPASFTLYTLTHAKLHAACLDDREHCHKYVIVCPMFVNVNHTQASGCVWPIYIGRWWPMRVSGGIAPQLGGRGQHGLPHHRGQQLLLLKEHRESLSLCGAKRPKPS